MLRGNIESGEPRLGCTHLWIACVRAIASVPRSSLSPRPARDEAIDAGLVLGTATSARRPGENCAWVDFAAVLRTLPLLHCRRLHRIVGVLIAEPIRLAPGCRFFQCWCTCTVLRRALGRAHVTATFTTDEAAARCSRVEDLACTCRIIPMLPKQLGECYNFHSSPACRVPEVGSDCPDLRTPRRQ